jgi:hypothetical protein
MKLLISPGLRDFSPEVRKTFARCALSIEIPLCFGPFVSLEQCRQVSARVRDRDNMAMVAANDVDDAIRANSDFSDRVLLNLRYDGPEPRKTRQRASGSGESGS